MAKLITKYIAILIKQKRDQLIKLITTKQTKKF